MKKNQIFIFLITLIIFFPLKIIAAEETDFKLILTCPEVIDRNETFNCDIAVNTMDKTFTKISAMVRGGTSYEVVDFTPAEGLNDNESTSSIISVTHDTGKKGTFGIGTVKVKASIVGSLTVQKYPFILYNATANDINGMSYATDGISAEIRTKSVNNYLTDISLSNGTLSPTFSKVKTTYTASIDAETTTITAIKGDEYQTVRGDGIKTLNYGLNTFEIAATSESGITKTYTLNITRPDNRSKTNTLETLTLNDETIDLLPDTKTYDITVENEKLIISSTLTDEKSKYVEGFGNREVNLVYGLNTILIKVQAENDDINTYTLNVTRLDTRSKINTLVYVDLGVSKIFFANNTSYDITVAEPVSKVTIKSELTDKMSKYVEGFGDREVTLAYGLNPIIIKVQAENGDIKTYTINVTRISKTGATNTLKTLTLSEGKINFSSNVRNYDVTVSENTSKITITSTLTDEKSKYVEGFGNREVKLAYGLNPIIIKVQAENGSINTYSVNVTRTDPRSSINTLKTLSLNSGNINFSPDVKTYNVTVDNNVTEITIISTLTDEKSKYVEGFGNRKVSLTYGLNQILVKVQAENEEINTYVLNVKKLNNEENLKNIDVSKVIINKKVIENFSDQYDLILENPTPLNIEVELVNKKATYEIIGNENLQDGSKVIIKVTSEDKTNIKEYKINVKINKEKDIFEENKEKEETFNALTPVSIGILILGLSVFSYAIYNIKNNNIN